MQYRFQLKVHFVYFLAYRYFKENNELNMKNVSKICRKICLYNDTTYLDIFFSLNVREMIRTVQKNCVNNFETHVLLAFSSGSSGLNATVLVSSEYICQPKGMAFLIFHNCVHNKCSACFCYVFNSNNAK